jgi:RecJ-like exonuclease
MTRNQKVWLAVQAELLALRNIRDTTIPNLNAEWSEKLRMALKKAEALREKYSTVCPDCDGVGGFNEGRDVCPKCHGTGRVMMLDAEGVKMKRDNHSLHGHCDCDNTDNHAMCDALEDAFNTVLKGDSND